MRNMKINLRGSPNQSTDVVLNSQLSIIRGMARHPHMEEPPNSNRNCGFHDIAVITGRPVGKSLRNARPFFNHGEMK